MVSVSDSTFRIIYLLAGIVLMSEEKDFFLTTSKNLFFYVVSINQIIYQTIAEINLLLIYCLGFLIVQTFFFIVVKFSQLKKNSSVLFFSSKSLFKTKTMFFCRKRDKVVKCGCQGSRLIFFTPCPGSIQNQNVFFLNFITCSC